MTQSTADESRAAFEKWYNGQRKKSAVTFWQCWQAAHKAGVIHGLEVVGEIHDAQNDEPLADLESKRSPQ